MIKVHASSNTADVFRAARAIAGALTVRASRTCAPTNTQQAANCTSTLREHSDGCKMLHVTENTFCLPIAIPTAGQNGIR